MTNKPAASHLCRVCGAHYAEPPWGADGKTASFDICDCCGVEFGYEDSTPAAVAAYRSGWIARGLPWFKPARKPADWNGARQLARIGAVLATKELGPS